MQVLLETHLLQKGYESVRGLPFYVIFKLYLFKIMLKIRNMVKTLMKIHADL